MRMESHRGFANAVAVRPLTIDDMAAVRSMHSLSLRCLTGLGDDEIEALTADIQSPEYTDRLMTGRILLGWLDGVLVGSVGWSMTARDNRTAVIASVFVHPLFTGCGIGRRLVRTAETEARGLGFTAFSAPVTPNAVGFFERLGYRVVSRRRNRMGKGSAMPLAMAVRMDRVTDRRIPAPMANA